MADNNISTTSSESILNENSPTNVAKDNNNNNNLNNNKINDTKTTNLIKTNLKGNPDKNIPIQTNLHRFLQNKLKRKNKLPTNTIIIDNTTNKKRKTKMNETQINETNLINNDNSNISCDSVKCLNNINNENSVGDFSNKRVITKPPLPPSKSEKNTQTQMVQTLPLPSTKVPTVPSPTVRVKRKLDEQNVAHVNKLNAHAEQLRLEVSDLKVALTNEKTAVRLLRAHYESETRKSKSDIKKLQTTIDIMKKAAISTAQKKLKDDGLQQQQQQTIKDFGGCDLNKLTIEVSALKEANRILEEKIQIFNEAERRKNSDIRELKDSYEIRLTQITKSAKTEINRLLEEIKTKERNIGQLKKEVHSLKSGTITNKKDLRTVQHPPEMRKLKDIERTNSANSSNEKCITTTCGENEFNSMPHEINERILEAHDDLHIFRNKDPINSDSDSALSSAPPSISPQPPSSGIDSPDIWQSVKNYSKELTNLQNDNESLQRENEKIKKELESAKQQIEDLEKNVLEARDNTKMQKLFEKIQYLQQKEDNLLKESHELREQNELLEFRILELEESNDKWSLRSNSTPDTRDMWTDTEKETDDIIMYTERSDSGITSPHSHHHMDDRNIISPFDLSMLDQASNDEIRRRIQGMTKRPNIDEDDKLCLLQVLSLLNNLEALSQDSMIGSEEMMMSIDLVKTKTSDYNSSTSSSPRSFLTDSIQKSKNGRIVATVLPYSSALSTPTDSPRKLRNWNTSSLQESGVFEGDQSDTYTQYTQTDPEDFPCQDVVANGDLCAEIQKLNKFREKIEECVIKSSSTVKTPVQGILSPNLSDQRRLQYYKNRLELLENKILIYESSGDLQNKRLADRLQREIQLDGLVKELRERVNSLETDNLRLEEERCEFEEAENDTRLRLQRLEIDLEILNQRNIELDMSREAVQIKLKEARAQCTCLQENIIKYQENIKTLESEEIYLKTKMDLIKTSMPAILLYNAFMVNDMTTKNSLLDANNSIVSKQCSCSEFLDPTNLHDRIHELKSRENELIQNITELNRAYNETLESADNLWAQMEKDYKDRLEIAKNTENSLKGKILQLEQRLQYDSQCAQERIAQLEESELNLKHRLCRLNKENKDLTHEHEQFLTEYQTIKDEYINLKKFLEGPAQENLDKEKHKVRQLEEDLQLANKIFSETEVIHKNELQFLRNHLTKTNKELLHIEVTNSELKEEVFTLEMQLDDLHKQRHLDEDKIRNLTDELLRSKEEQQNIKVQTTHTINAPSLAQELGPIKRVGTDEIDDLSTASEKLAEAIANIEDCGACSPGNEAIKDIAKEVKTLADAIISHKSGKKMKPSDEGINRMTKFYV